MSAVVDLALRTVVVDQETLHTVRHLKLLQSSHAIGSLEPHRIDASKHRDDSLTCTTVGSRLCRRRDKTCWWMRCHRVCCNTCNGKCRSVHFVGRRFDLSQRYVVPLPERTRDDTFQRSTGIAETVHRVSIFAYYVLSVSSLLPENLLTRDVSIERFSKPCLTSIIYFGCQTLYYSMIHFILFQCKRVNLTKQS